MVLRDTTGTIPPRIVHLTKYTYYLFYYQAFDLSIFKNEKRIKKLLSRSSKDLSLTLVYAIYSPGPWFP